MLFCFGRLFDVRLFEEGNCKFNFSIKKVDKKIKENENWIKDKIEIEYIYYLNMCWEVISGIFLYFLGRRW